ncbi:terminal organelle tip protein HMW2 [Mycoplasmoides gallisepticum]|uniref:terminal organelle tip protein HMW2 n=1 Tax=Mycoplasmoides gallisepticum TaxID=2096 RepID=UPI00334451FC
MQKDYMKLHSNSDFDADQLDEHDDNVFQDVYDTGFDDGYIKANQENLIANQYKKLDKNSYQNGNNSFYTKDELEKLKKKSFQVNQDIDYYQQAQTEISSERQRLLQAIDDLEANQDQFHPEDFQAERQYLINELDRLDSELYHIEQYKNDSIDFVNELNQRLSAEQAKIDSYNSSLDKNIRKDYIQIDQLKNKLAEETTEYNDLLNRSTDEISEIDRQSERLQNLIDERIAKLNNDSYGVSSLDSSTRERLKKEIHDLSEQRKKLQSAKKLHLYNLNLKKESIRRYRSQLEQYLESLKQMRNEHNKKLKGYAQNLDNIKNEVEKAKQNFNDQQLKILQSKANADQYFALRKIELENSYKKAKNAILEANKAYAKNVQEEQALANKNNKTQRLLNKLKEDYDRLKIASLSFESMRKQSLAALNNLQDELKQKHNLLERKKHEQDGIVNEKISELEGYRSDLVDQKLKIEREKENQERRYKAAEASLNKKRQEIDELFLEANTKLNEASLKENDLNNQKREILAKLRNLEHLKSEIDQRRRDLDQRELIDQQTIRKIQLDVESERADLQRILLIERKKNDERQQELLQYERDIKRQQTDFENTVNWEQKKLSQREKELKDGYEQLQLKQSEVQEKIDELNEEINRAQKSKQNSLVLEQKLKSDLEHLNLSKNYLDKQQEELNQKSDKMIEDLKVFERDLKRQKEDLSIYEKSLQQKEASLINFQNDVTVQKNEAYHKAQAIHQELELKKAAIENELRKLTAERKAVDADKEENTKLKKFIDEEIRSLANERKELEIYQNNIENFKNNAVDRLNVLESDLVKKRNELEQLKKEQQTHYNELNSNLTNELQELEEQKKKFAHQKQQKFEELLQAKNNLSIKENELVLYAQKVNDRYNELKAIEKSNTAKSEMINAKLEEFKHAEIDYLNYQNKIKQEQIKFDNQVKILESQYYQRNEILLIREEQIKQKKAEQQAQEKQIQKDFKRLQEEKNNFDDQKRNKFNKISNLYLEIKKQRDEVDLAQRQIEDQKEELLIKAREGRLQKQEIEDRLAVLEKSEKRFRQEDELLAKKRIDLIERIGVLKADINKKHEILSLRSVQLTEKAKKQQEKDADLQRKFDLLESEVERFNEEKKSEFQKLKVERDKLAHREKNVSKNMNEINLALAKLDLIRKNNKVDKAKINEKLALLNDQKEKIDRENDLLDAKKTEVITRLRKMENDLEFEKQKVLLDRSNIERISSDQQALARELETKYQTLEREKRSFSQRKENELKEIDDFYQQVQHKERTLNLKIEDLKQLRYLLEKESYNVNVNKKDLKVRIEHYQRLERAIKNEQHKLNNQKNNFFNKVELLNDQLNKKSSKIALLRSKIYNTYKQQQQQKQILLEEKHKNSQLRKSLLKTQEELHQQKAQFSIAKKQEEKKLKNQKDLIQNTLSEVIKQKDQITNIKQEVDLKQTQLNNLEKLIIKQRADLQKELEKNSENTYRLQKAERLLEEKKTKLRLEYDKAKKVLSTAKATDQALKTKQAKVQDQFKKLVLINKKIIEARNNLLKQRNIIQKEINNRNMANFQNPYPNFLNLAPNTQVVPAQTIMPVQTPQLVGVNYPNQPAFDFNNPLMQMQQLINQQQMLMMQKEHQWALEEANKKNSRLAKQLKQLKHHKQALTESTSEHLNYHNLLNADNSYKINSLQNLLSKVAYNTKRRINQLEHNLDPETADLNQLHELNANSQLLDEIRTVLSNTTTNTNAVVPANSYSKELRMLFDEIKADFKKQAVLFNTQKEVFTNQINQLAQAVEQGPIEVRKTLESQDQKYQQMFDNFRDAYEQNISLLRNENNEVQKKLTDLYDEIAAIKTNTEKIKKTTLRPEVRNNANEGLASFNSVNRDKKDYLDQTLPVHQNLRIDLNQNRDLSHAKKERINQLANEIKTIKELIEKRKQTSL